MNRRDLVRAGLVVTLGLAFAAYGPPPAAAGEEPEVLAWPFGDDGKGGGLQHGVDLYNLGPLGLKVRDASIPLPSRKFESGVRSSKPLDDPAPANLGATELAVEMLFPGGPAAKAKLRRGDVLTGVGGRPFEVGSLATIADAIKAAESGATKGIVAFTVKRAGAPQPLTVEVTLAVRGKEWATPLVGKPRESIIEAACKWLGEREASGALRSASLASEEGVATQASLAGLAWLATGSDLSKGRYAKHVKGAYATVAATLTGTSRTPDAMGPAPGSDGPGGGANWNQSNWRWVHAAIFLGELYSRCPSTELRNLVHRCGAEIAQRQEKSGGWAHGPGGPNGLGYVELNIMSVLAMQGLGMAATAGYEVPPDVLKRGKAYLEQCCGEDGGIAYSADPRQIGHGNIGRTAGAWLACQNLGLREDPLAFRLAQYVRANCGDVFNGHASLMQHYLFSGVASQSLGIDPARAYWATCERDMILARSPDGSFQPRAWAETISMSSNSDVSFGEIWTTAAWTVVLASPPLEGVRPGLPVWTGRAAAAPSKPKK